jgi:coenzyme F420-reducing hydrogenase delta subunit
VTYLKSVLDTIGIESERVEMVNVSAAMAAEFIEKATSLYEKLLELGPNPLRNGS